MICVPLDDVEDVLQRRLQAVCSPLKDGLFLGRTDEAIGNLLLELIDELTALKVDTEARACQECGDPGLKHCRYDAYYCEPCWEDLSE